MTHARERIHDHVVEHPGVHFNELARALDLAPGQVQYHVRRLRRRDRLVAESLYGRTHYFAPDYDEWERGAVAVLRRETARDVVATLLASGPDSPATVAEALGVARSTLEWYLDHLVEQDVVEKRRDDRGRVTLALVDPEATADLLVAVDPSLADRLLDRFERLVDDLVAESRGTRAADGGG